MKLTRLFNEFFESEKSAGFLLLGCTVVSMLLANTGMGWYTGFWEMQIGGHSLTHWINDGLMAVFFLLIGLELEREIYQGELSEPRNALLPIFAALGGMCVPAGIYFFINKDLASSAGTGIPMATDIAFATGMLSLLGKRVPAALKVFLTALAVIDDLGAIIIIAIFYSKGIVLLNLGIALGIFAVLLVCKRMKLRFMLLYLIGGVAMWYFMLHSGVHATIAGVLLAFAIPFGDGGERSLSYQLQHWLHKPVSFIILPLFALANTCILLPAGWSRDLASAASVGIFLGLVVGKPLGIYLFSRFAVAIRLCKLPSGVNWWSLGGAGMLAGIGFTMSIFITLLAYADVRLIAESKIAILLASLIAATAGLLWLRFSTKAATNEIDN